MLDARRLDPDVHIFCIPQWPALTLATDTFVDRVESAELTGFWFDRPLALSHRDAARR